VASRNEDGEVIAGFPTQEQAQAYAPAGGKGKVKQASLFEYEGSLEFRGTDLFLDDGNFDIILSEELGLSLKRNDSFQLGNCRIVIYPLDEA
jgi:hypothetical protein